MKSLVLSLTGLLLLATPALADDIREVETFVRNNVDIVISSLQNRSLDKQERNARIMKVVNSTFDFDLMARLSLGQKHWPSLSVSEKKEFTRLFTEHLQESYLEKLDLYTNEEVVYEPGRKVKRRIHVPTFLVSEDTKLSMLYKLYKSEAGWKVYDLEIQGVSVIQTYRSQFDSVLTSGTTTGLLEKLRSPGEFQIDTSQPAKDTANR